MKTYTIIIQRVTKEEAVFVIEADNIRDAALYADERVNSAYGSNFSWETVNDNTPRVTSIIEDLTKGAK